MCVATRWLVCLVAFFLSPIMKQFLLSLFSALLLMPVCAQNLVQQFADDPGRSGGVYYAYPAPIVTQVTAPPMGYQPFYISHYGRHGSRYMLSDNDYLKAIKMMEKADSSSVLTPLGVDVLNRLRVIWAEAEGHTDELAPLGKLQHRGIAERMYHTYPAVFEGGGRVSARSTTSMRCALSMVAFCERLKEINPELNLFWETSKKNMIFMNYHSHEYEAQKKDPKGWMADFMKYCQRPGIDPTRFVSQLISDSSWYQGMYPRMLMNALYDVASDLQDMDCDVSLYDLFTPEELVECWRNGNAWFYYSDADAVGNKGEALKTCQHLVDNIIEEADRAIAGEGDAATLRFGHDGNIIPLAACLHIEHCDASLSDPTLIEQNWQNYYVSPMAANIQLVFFRKEGSDDILVKFLHNEREVKITALKSKIAPFYHWKDVKKMLQK